MYLSIYPALFFCIFLIFIYTLSPCNTMFINERRVFMRNVLFKTGKIAWKVLKKTVRGIVMFVSFIEAVTEKKGEDK